MQLDPEDIKEAERHPHRAALNLIAAIGPEKAFDLILYHITRYKREAVSDLLNTNFHTRIERETL